MKLLSESSFGKKYNTCFIWVLIIAGLFLIVTILPQLVKAKWEEKEGVQWPLLLILIDVIDVPKSKFFMGREFKNIQISVFGKGEPVQLRSAPAFPWEVTGTRWSYELK